MSNFGGTSSESITESYEFFQLTKFVEQMETQGTISGASMDALLLELVVRRLVERHGTTATMMVLVRLLEQIEVLGPFYEMKDQSIH